MTGMCFLHSRPEAAGDQTPAYNYTQISSTITLGLFYVQYTRVYAPEHWFTVINTNRNNNQTFFPFKMLKDILQKWVKVQEIKYKSEIK